MMQKYNGFLSGVRTYRANGKPSTRKGYNVPRHYVRTLEASLGVNQDGPKAEGENAEDLVYAD